MVQPSGGARAPTPSARPDHVEERRAKPLGRRASDAADEPKSGPVYDCSRLLKYNRILRKTEKSVLIALRLACWDEGHSAIDWEPPQPPPDRPQDAPPRQFTPRISAKEIGDRCGIDCSSRSVQRLIPILEMTGIITVTREKTDKGDNFPNGFEWHPDKARQWERLAKKDRPKAWKPKKKADSCRNPPLTTHADALEAARVAANLPKHDATVRRLTPIAEKIDREIALLPTAKTGLAERERRQEDRLAGYLAELAKLGAPTPPAPPGADEASPRAAARRAPGAPSTPPSPAPAPAVDVDDEAAQLADLRARGLLEEEEPVVEEARRGADEGACEGGAAFAVGIEAAIVAMRFTFEVLTAIQSYPALAVRANEDDARAAAKMAWVTFDFFYPLAPTLHALQAFDEKVRGVRPGKKYRPDLAALLKFIQVQRPRADAPPAPPVSSLQPAGTWRPGRTVATPAPAAERFAPRIERAPPTETIAPPPPLLESNAPRVTPAGQDIFDRAVEHTRTLSPATFDQWFGGVQFGGLVDGVLSLCAQNEFVQEWVRVNFLPTLADKICELTGDGFEVVWSIDLNLAEPVVKSVRPLPRRPRLPPPGPKPSRP